MKINNKKIIFTDHLLMRLKTRNIKREDVREVFKKSAETKRGYEKANLVTAKINGGKKLTVVYEEKITTIIVITAYWEEA